MLTYQIKVLSKNPKRPDWNLGSTDDKRAALDLAIATPFKVDERVVVQESNRGGFIFIKRGMKA